MYSDDLAVLPFRNLSNPPRMQANMLSIDIVHEFTFVSFSFMAQRVFAPN